jgi:uncharacterized membrane protein YeaQ/YmgE (transglycosylase-associated protein family)
MHPLSILLFIGLFAGGIATNIVTWRLDWILLHGHPELHREWQLDRIWIVWRSPGIERRLRALGDARIIKLLNQSRAISAFSIAMFGALVILALFEVVVSHSN